MVTNYFPTPIYKVKYENDLTELKATVIPKIKQLWTLHDWADYPNMMEGALCSYSQTYDIKAWPELKPVIDFLKSHLNSYLDVLGVKENIELEVNSTWVSYFPPGAYLNYHTHDFSGIATVFYLSKPDNSGNLKIKNNFNIWDFYRSKHDNMIVVEDQEDIIEVEEGDLVMFPAFLAHGTEKNLSTMDRAIIGTDFLFKYKA